MDSTTLSSPLSLSTTNNPDKPLKGQTLALIILFCLGLGNLLPWNAFITASTYYGNRLCNSQFANNYENFFSMFYNFTQPIGLILSIIYKKQISNTQMIMYPLIIYAGLMIINTIFVGIDSMSPNALFGFTLLFTMVFGVCSALMNGGLFGIAGPLPSKYTGCIMNGQGLAGLGISLVNLITIAAAGSSTCDDNDDDTSGNDDNDCTSYTLDPAALSYFLVSSIVLVICIGLYYILMQLEFIIYYQQQYLQQLQLKKEQQLHQEQIQLEHLQIVNPMNEPTTTTTTTNSLSASPLPINTIPDNSIVTLQDERNTSTDFDLSYNSRLQAKEHDKNIYDRIWKIMPLIWEPAIAVCMTFFLSLAVFPSLVVQIEPMESCSSNKMLNDLWEPILFLCFNCFDFLGRSMAIYVADWSIGQPRNLLIASCLRFVLVFLLCFCNIQHSVFPQAFPNDFPPIFIMILIGLTNGLVANLSMMKGPQLVKPKDQSLVGTIMIFFLSFGLLLGSCISFLVLYIVQR